MTGVQEKLVELLKEIDIICKDIGCCFWLAGKTAENAISSVGFVSEEIDAEIWMQDEDFLKFCNEVKITRPNRAVEGINTNCKFPGTYYLYVAKDTLLYDLDTAPYQKTYGISIRIYLLQNRNNLKLISKVQNYSRYILELSHIPREKMKEKSRKKRIIWRFANIVQKITRYRFAALIYNYCRAHTHSNDKDVYSVEQYLSGLIELPKEWFVKSSCVQICGYNFFVPSHFDEIIQRGKSCINVRQKNYMIIADSRIPYRTYLEMVDEMNLLPSGFFWKRRKYIYQSTVFLKPIRKKIRKTWDLLFMTEERYKLWKRYMPEKEYIVNLYTKKDYRALEDILGDYLTSLSYYSRKGYAICFDYDIWNIGLELLEIKGEGKEVEILKEQAFREHFEPIQIL